MRIENFDTSVKSAEEIHCRTTGNRNAGDWRSETLYLVKRTGGFVLFIETGMDHSEDMGASWGESLPRGEAKEWLLSHGGGAQVEKYFSGK